MMKKKLGPFGNICRWWREQEEKEDHAEIEYIEDWCQTDVYSAVLIAQDRG